MKDVHLYVNARNNIKTFSLMHSSGPDAVSANSNINKCDTPLLFIMCRIRF